MLTYLVMPLHPSWLLLHPLGPLLSSPQGPVLLWSPSCCPAGGQRLLVFCVNVVGIRGGIGGELPMLSYCWTKIQSGHSALCWVQGSAHIWGQLCLPPPLFFLQWASASATAASTTLCCWTKAMASESKEQMWMVPQWNDLKDQVQYHQCMH
jgi:hypothetical protein